MSMSDLIASLFGAGIVGEKHASLQPPFVLEEYFNGTINLWGMIQNRRGNIINRFEAVMHCHWQGNQGTFKEHFIYYDSALKQDRVWQVTKLSDTRYQAQAGDILGTAEGQTYGNAMRWRYAMDVPVDSTRHRLQFNDWMWAMQNGVVINRSYMKKWGITVAELTAFMQKQ